jgi:hypothetical protein
MNMQQDEDTIKDDDTAEDLPVPDEDEDDRSADDADDWEDDDDDEDDEDEEVDS